MYIAEGGMFKPMVIYGASTDEKPTEYRDGSIFIETDTHKIFMFDEKNSTWREIV